MILLYRVVQNWLGVLGVPGAFVSMGVKKSDMACRAVIGHLEVWIGCHNPYLGVVHVFGSVVE